MDQQTTIEERFGKCPYATAQSIISGKWAVQEMREQLRHQLDKYPVRGGASSVLNQ